MPDLLPSLVTAALLLLAALALYQAARALGLNASEALPECDLPADLPMAARAQATGYLLGPGYAALLSPATPAQQYNSAYWLREKLLADILSALPPASRPECLRLFYTGQIAALATALPALTAAP